MRTVLLRRNAYPPSPGAKNEKERHLARPPAKEKARGKLQLTQKQQLFGFSLTSPYFDKSRCACVDACLSCSGDIRAIISFAAFRINGLLFII